MEIKWVDVSGSYMPEPFYIYNNEYAIFTQNVQQIEENMWTWQELAVSKDLYDFIATMVKLVVENYETKNVNEDDINVES